MNRSEQVNELAAALAKAQGLMEGARKDKTNPHFRSQYADLGSVWEAIREPLSKNGISVLQLPFEDAQGRISVETTVMHASGQWMSATYCLPPQQNTPQGIGSAITYMKRYALTGLGVAPEDDDGNAASGKPDPIGPYSSAPSKPQAAKTNGNGDKAASEKWTNEQIATLRAFTDHADLPSWEARQEKAILRLAQTDPDSHRRLMDAMADTYAKFSPLAAE